MFAFISGRQLLWKENCWPTSTRSRWPKEMTCRNPAIAVWMCIVLLDVAVKSQQSSSTWRSTFLSKYNKTTKRRRASSLPKWKKRKKLIFLFVSFLFFCFVFLLLLKLLRLLFYCGGGAFIRVEIDDTSESEQAKRVEEKTQTKKTRRERESSLSGRHPHNCTSRPRPSHHTRLHGNLLIIHRRGGAAAAAQRAVYYS